MKFALESKPKGPIPRTYSHEIWHKVRTYKINEEKFRKVKVFYKKNNYKLKLIKFSKLYFPLTYNTEIGTEAESG